MYAHLWGEWNRAIWLLAGIAEAGILRHLAFKQAQVECQESDFSILYIAGLVMLWVMVLFSGLALQDAGVITLAR